MTDPTAPTTPAEDLLIPILLASNPGMKLDYKTMSALDGKKTPSAFEHRFRKYRARAQEILATRGGDVGAGAIPEGLVPVTPTKKRVKKTTDEGVNEDDADGEVTPKKKARVPKDAEDPTTPETSKKIATTPKPPKTPTTPKATKNPKTPKSPKAGKASKGKTEVKPETEEVDDVNLEGLDSAKHARMAAAGEVLMQEMSFEFEGSQVED